MNSYSKIRYCFTHGCIHHLNYRVSFMNSFVQSTFFSIYNYFQSFYYTSQTIKIRWSIIDVFVAHIHVFSFKINCTFLSSSFGISVQVWFLITIIIIWEIYTKSIALPPPLICIAFLRLSTFYRFIFIVVVVVIQKH